MGKAGARRPHTPSAWIPADEAVPLFAKGTVAQLRRLLKGGVDKDQLIELPRCASAAISKTITRTIAILQRADAKDRRYPLLLLACAIGSHSHVELLLKAGANVKWEHPSTSLNAAHAVMLNHRRTLRERKAMLQLLRERCGDDSLFHRTWRFERSDPNARMDIMMTLALLGLEALDTDTQQPSPSCDADDLEFLSGYVVRDLNLVEARMADVKRWKVAAQISMAPPCVLELSACFLVTPDVLPVYLRVLNKVGALAVWQTTDDAARAFASVMLHGYEKVDKSSDSMSQLQLTRALLPEIVEAFAEVVTSRWPCNGEGKQVLELILQLCYTHPDCVERLLLAGLSPDVHLAQQLAHPASDLLVEGTSRQRCEAPQQSSGRDQKSGSTADSKGDMSKTPASHTMPEVALLTEAQRDFALLMTSMHGTHTRHLDAVLPRSHGDHANASTLLEVCAANHTSWAPKVVEILLRHMSGQNMHASHGHHLLAAMARGTATGNPEVVRLLESYANRPNPAVPNECNTSLLGLATTSVNGQQQVPQPNVHRNSSSSSGSGGIKDDCGHGNPSPSRSTPSSPSGATKVASSAEAHVAAATQIAQAYEALLRAAQDTARLRVPDSVRLQLIRDYMHMLGIQQVFSLLGLLLPESRSVTAAFITAAQACFSGACTGDEQTPQAAAGRVLASVQAQAADFYLRHPSCLAFRRLLNLEAFHPLAEHLSSVQESAALAPAGLSAAMIASGGRPQRKCGPAELAVLCSFSETARRQHSAAMLRQYVMLGYHKDLLRVLCIVEGAEYAPARQAAARDLQVLVEAVPAALQDVLPVLLSCSHCPVQPVAPVSAPVLPPIGIGARPADARNPDGGAGAKASSASAELGRMLRFAFGEAVGAALTTGEQKHADEDDEEERQLQEELELDLERQQEVASDDDSSADCSGSSSGGGGSGSASFACDSGSGNEDSVAMAVPCAVPRAAQHSSKAEEEERVQLIELLAALVASAAAAVAPSAPCAAQSWAEPAGSCNTAAAAAATGTAGGLPTGPAVQWRALQRRLVGSPLWCMARGIADGRISAGLEGAWDDAKLGIFKRCRAATIGLRTLRQELLRERRQARWQQKQVAAS